MRSHYILLNIVISPAIAFVDDANQPNVFPRNLTSSDIDISLFSRDIEVAGATLLPRGKRRPAQTVDNSGSTEQKDAPTKSKKTESSPANPIRSPSKAGPTSQASPRSKNKIDSAQKSPAKASPEVDHTNYSPTGAQFDLAKLRLSQYTSTGLVGSAAQSNIARGRSPSPSAGPSSLREAQSGIARGRSNSPDSSDVSRSVSPASTTSNSRTSSPPRIAFTDAPYKDSIAVVAKRKEEIKKFKKINEQRPPKSSTNIHRGLRRQVLLAKSNASRARRDYKQIAPGLVDDINKKSSMDPTYIDAISKSVDSSMKVLETGRSHSVAEALTAQGLADRGTFARVPQHLSASARAQSRVFLQERYEAALLEKTRSKYFKEKLSKYRDSDVRYTPAEQHAALDAAVEARTRYSKFSSEFSMEPPWRGLYSSYLTL